MLPTPIISTETLLSCADATQIEAPKMIDANRDGFIVHQGMLAPLERRSRLLRKSSDRAVHRNAATNDARKLRGTIEGSINVDAQQHHHELGRSVTTEGGFSLRRFHL